MNLLVDELTYENVNLLPVGPLVYDGPFDEDDSEDAEADDDQDEEDDSDED